MPEEADGGSSRYNYGVYGGNGGTGELIINNITTTSGSTVNITVGAGGYDGQQGASNMTERDGGNRRTFIR